MPHHRLPTNGNAKARMPPPPPPGPSLGPSLVPVAKMPDRLQHLTGALEVRFKTGAFATWSDMFLRLEGRWLTIYRRERDVMRQAAIELGPGVRVTDLGAHEAATKFPRRFDVFCKGGLLPATEVSFRTKSRKDRDLWVLAIGANIQLLTTLGADPAYAVQDLDPTVDRMKDGLKLHPIRIRSDLVVRCATGEAIVEFLVNEQLARDKHHAILVGRRLLAMNLIHHVVWEQDFTDSHEPFVIAALEDESESYEADHFQKYLDSRKFWKFLDSDGSSSGSRSNRTALRSTGSGGGSVSRNITSSYSSVAAPTPDSVARAPSSFVDNGREDANATAKKAKKCSICTKSFNPLRRRHVCRSCGSPVCGNCSVARRSTEEGSSSSRMCISCKLSATNSSQDDFYDRIFAGPPSNSVSTGNGSTSDMTDPHRTSRASHASSSSSSDLHSASSAAGRGALSGSASNAESTSDCLQCGDSACAPLRDAVDVPYPSVMAPSGGFVSALPFNDEASRLETVSAIRETITATPNALRVMSQFAQMAAIASSCPLGAVGLLADGAYHIYALYGVKEDIKSVARSQAFAAHACRNLGPIVVSDVRADVRFAGNPWRREVLQRAAFYAGMPLTLSNGHTVGAVEVFDLEPRYACMDTVAQLQTVVRAVVKLLEDIFAAGSQAKAEAEAEAKAAAAAPAAAPSEQVAEKEPPANEMEAKLLQLLSQTTSTQEQLRTQQTTMVHAISSHSKQISELAKQLERMEATLASKLDGQ